MAAAVPMLHGQITMPAVRNEPLAMPWDNAIYFFDPAHFRTLFPAEIVEAMCDDTGDLNEKLVLGTSEPIARAIMLVEGRFNGNGGCSFFCNGKYGPRRQNLCSTLPQR